ncbi:MAG: hypothetical protein ACREJN_09085 [Nitrospiraceae bacterium]
MPRTPLRFAGPGQLTNAAVTKYTVPAVTLSIMRHIHVTNPSGAAVTFTMSIGADAAGTRIFDGYSIAAGAILDHFCYYVLQPAEIVQALASVTTTLNLTIDGDQYTLG